MKTSHENSIWSAFEEPEALRPPEISLALETPIRYPSPAERLARWFLGGVPTLFLSLLLLSSFQVSVLSPWQVVRVVLLTGVVTWLVLPFTGRHPSATPGRLALSGLAGLSLFILLAYPTQYLLPDTYKSGFTIERVRDFQNTVELLTTWKVLIPTLSMLLFLCFLTRWFGLRYFWLEPKAQRSTVRVWFSLALIIFPLLFAVLYPAWVDKTSRRVEWVADAKLHDPFQNSPQRFSEDNVCNLQNSFLAPFAFQQPEMARSALRNLSQDQHTDLMTALITELRAPDFRPSSEDVYLLGLVAERAVLKDTPTEKSALFTLEFWQLANRTRQPFHGFGAVEEAFEDVLIPYLAELPLDEVEAWQDRLQSLTTFEVTPIDIDSIVLEQIERPMGLYETEKPLEILGFQVTDRSLAEMYSELRDRTLLMDYAERRKALARGFHLHQAIIEARGPRLLDTDIQAFYNFLNYTLNPDLLERNRLLAQTVLQLRDQRLRQGRYPDEAPGPLPSEYSYRIQGSQAVVGRRDPMREWLLP